MIFKPYTFEQIEEILKHRLGELQLEGFDDKIRELVARKAAHVGGTYCTATCHYQLEY